MKTLKRVFQSSLLGDFFCFVHINESQRNPNWWLIRLPKTSAGIANLEYCKETKEEKIHIEANPQFKTLNLYDAKMQKVFQGIEKKEVKQEPEKSKEKKETQKQETDEEGEAKKEKKSSRKRGVGV